MSQRIKSTTLALLLFSLVIGYAWSAITLFRAYRAASSNRIEGLQEAVRLAPWNAEYSLLLARSQTLGLMDFPRGIQEYQRGMALNPYSSRGWLDLAAAYQITGDAERQRQAIEKAIQVDPTTPSVAWEVASFYVLQGRVDKSLPLYRTVLSSRGSDATSVLEVLWPATRGNAEMILAGALPPDPKVHADFLAFAAKRKDLESARKIWSRMVELRAAIPTQEAFPYVQLLMDTGHADEAAHAWTQLSDMQPKVREYLPTAENLVVNGDFEKDLLGGGLEWHFAKQHYVELKVDSLVFHGGNHSLAATFEGGPAATLGLEQRVPVKGGFPYSLSVFVKAEDLNTASGPRISVSDAYTKQRLYLSEDHRGSTPWKEISATFLIPAGTSAVRIDVVREPASLIKGRFYVDDVVLRRAP